MWQTLSFYYHFCSLQWLPVKQECFYDLMNEKIRAQRHKAAHSLGLTTQPAGLVHMSLGLSWAWLPSPVGSSFWLERTWTQGIFRRNRWQNPWVSAMTTALTWTQAGFIRRMLVCSESQWEIWRNRPQIAGSKPTVQQDTSKTLEHHCLHCWLSLPRFIV
jgi:hypothetical protein